MKNDSQKEEIQQGFWKNKQMSEMSKIMATEHIY